MIDSIYIYKTLDPAACMKGKDDATTLRRLFCPKMVQTPGTRMFDLACSRGLPKILDAIYVLLICFSSENH
jgi:hypothetical protein